MSDAKDYPNTIEPVAKILYEELMLSIQKEFGLPGPSFKWSDANERTHDYMKLKVITVLNAVNYFEGKTCKDCDFFERAPCITPEGDYSEDPDRQICINFVLKK